MFALREKYRLAVYLAVIDLVRLALEELPQAGGDGREPLALRSLRLTPLLALESGLQKELASFSSTESATRYSDVEGEDARELPMKGDRKMRRVTKGSSKTSALAPIIFAALHEEIAGLLFDLCELSTLDDPAQQ